MNDPTPTSMSRWLEAALSGIGLPMMALVVLAATGGMYLVGVASEGAAAAVIVVIVSVTGAAAALRPGLADRVEPLSRGLAVAGAVGTLVVAGLPALSTVRPGRALVEGDLAARGDALSLPHGIPARARLLVHASIPPAGPTAVPFVLGGPNPPVHGRLERTGSYARVGPRGRAATPYDHSSEFLAARLAGVPELVLERLEGETAGPLHVSVHRDPLPGAAHGALALAVLAVVAVAQARLRAGSGAICAGTALGFGLLVTERATPDAAVGPTLAAVLVGGLAGAVAGALAGWLARRWVPPGSGAGGARAR